MTDKIEAFAGSKYGILLFLLWCAIMPLLSVDVANYGISFYTAGILVLTIGSSRRDRLAVHVKLDDLECAVDAAKTENARLEEKTEAEILEVRNQPNSGESA